MDEARAGPNFICLKDEEGQIKLKIGDEFRDIDWNDNIIIHLSTDQTFFTLKRLFRSFSKIGTLISVLIKREKNQEETSLLISICFEKKENSLILIEFLENQIAGFLNHNLFVVKNITIGSIFVQESNNNFIVKNLPIFLPKEDYFDLLCQFGEVTSLKLIVDRKHKSLGFGFVKFENFKSLKKGFEFWSNLNLRGKKIKVKNFHLNQKKNEEKKEKKPKYTNIYIKNINSEFCNQKSLEKIFAIFGTITSIHVPYGEEDVPLGYGFVNFLKSNQARNAVLKMHGKKIKSLILYAGKAEKKSEREIKSGKTHLPMNLKVGNSPKIKFWVTSRKQTRKLIFFVIKKELVQWDLKVIKGNMFGMDSKMTTVGTLHFSSDHNINILRKKVKRMVMDLGFSFEGLERKCSKQKKSEKNSLQYFRKEQKNFPGNIERKKDNIYTFIFEKGLKKLIKDHKGRKILILIFILISRKTGISKLDISRAKFLSFCFSQKQLISLMFQSKNVRLFLDSIF